MATNPCTALSLRLLSCRKTPYGAKVVVREEQRHIFRNAKSTAVELGLHFFIESEKLWLGSTAPVSKEKPLVYRRPYRGDMTMSTYVVLRLPGHGPP